MKRGTGSSFSAMTACSKYGSSWRRRARDIGNGVAGSGDVGSEVPFCLRRRAHVRSGGRAKGVFSWTPELLHAHRRRFPIEAGDADPLRLGDDVEPLHTAAAEVEPLFTTM